MYQINLIATSPAYKDTATMDCPSSRSITVQVSNAGVYYQLKLGTSGVRPDGESWGEDRFLPPGVWTFDTATDFRGFPCHAIRFRSATSAAALVTASA